MAQFNCKVVLCDIEGTTTSISFVKDTLFPYAAKNVESYLNENWKEEATQNVVKDLVALSKKDVSDKVEGAEVIEKVDEQAEFVASIVKNVEWQMSADRKTTELKELQGLIWKKAYDDGSIKGHVYDDVAKNFESWIASGLKIYIYSSGSVDAQKMLFEHSEAGDLLKHISGHFDTKIGAKQEADSYKAILKELELQAEDVLFLTDIAKEAEASKSAGMQAVLFDRLGSADFDEATTKSFKVVKSFDELTLSSSSLKRKIEDNDDQSAPAKVAKPDIPEAAQEPTKIEEVSVIAESKPEDSIADEVVPAKVTPIAEIEKKSEVSVQEPEAMEVDSAVVAPVIVAEKMIVEEEPKKIEEPVVIAAPEKTEEPVVVPDVSSKTPDAPEEPKIDPVIAEIDKETDMPKETEIQTEPDAEKVETVPVDPKVIAEEKMEELPKDLSVDAPKDEEPAKTVPVIEKIDEKVEESAKPVDASIVVETKQPDVESITPEVVEPIVEPITEQTEEKVIETNGTNGTIKAEEKTPVNGNEEKETPEVKTNGSSEHKEKKESENGSANGDSHTNGQKDIIEVNEPMAASKDILEEPVTPADLKAKLAEAPPPSVPVASES